MGIKGYKTITMGLVGITACSGLVLSAMISYADNDTAVDQVEITVPTACTMTGNIATGQEHTASLTPGTYSAATGSEYANGIGKTTLTTFCNDNNGFSIYAIGYTGDTYGDTTMIGTNTNLTINTGVYSSGDTTSKWSMKVTKVENPSQGDPVTFDPENMSIQNSFSSWHVVPDTYTKVAQYKASTGSSATDTALGAKVETTYAAYISTTQAADTYTGKVKYTMVHPYNADAPTTPLLMQNVTQWGSTLSTGDEITATDARDGKEYTVAKLADGNIWMTQNLDHDIGDIANGTYTSADTDISANWTPSTATYATGTTTWNGSYTAPESYDPGDLCWNGTIRSDYNGNISTDTTTCGNDKHYHIGNYYNWTAAVAMNDSSSYTTGNTDVNQSICPAGWRLPIGGTTNTGSKSFQYLVNQLSLTSGTSGNIQNSPVYFVYGGGWVGSSSGVGGFGIYWSSVVYGDGYAYYLYFRRTGNLYPRGSDYRDFGYSVRCVAR